MNTLAKPTTWRVIGAKARGALRSSAALLVFAPVMLLCGYVVFAPSINLLPGISLYDSKRLLQLAILGGSALLVATVPQMREGWLKTYGTLPRAARWGLWLLLGLGCTSALLAPVPRRALLDVFHYVLLFALCLTVASAYKAYPETFRKAILVTLAASVLLYLISFAVGYLMQFVDDGLKIWPEAYTGFTNKRFFNQFQTWTLPLMVGPALLLPLRAKWMRAGLMALAAGWWMLLLASGGRGTALGMVVALGVTGVLYRGRAGRWLRWQGVALAGGGLGYVLLFSVFTNAGGTLAERAGYYSGGGRLEDWHAAWEIASQHPLLGIGPMHTAYAPNQLWATPHNAVVQFATEWGFPALLLIATLVIWGGYAWFKRCYQRQQEQQAPSAERLTQVALTTALVAGAFHAMVSGVVVMPLSQVMLVIVIGWMLAIHMRDAKADVSALRPRGWALGAVLVGAVGIVLWGAYPEALSTGAMKIDWLMETKQMWLAPRYWHQGLFGY